MREGHAGLSRTGGRTTAEVGRKDQPNRGNDRGRNVKENQANAYVPLTITLKSECEVESGGCFRANPAEKSLEELPFSIRRVDFEQFLDLSAVEAPITSDFEGRQFATPDELVDGGAIHSQKGGHLCDCKHFVHRHLGIVAESG